MTQQRARTWRNGMHRSLAAALIAAAVAAPAAAHSTTVTASAYSPADAGPRTADGSPFTWQSNVVAHRTLPLGTRVAVHYRGRIAVTTVRDRGPYIPGRDLDLGPAVWRHLGGGITSPYQWGHRPVKLRILPAEPRRPAVWRPRQAGRPMARHSVARWQQLIARRTRALISIYGQFPWPVFDTTMTGNVAGWVMAREGQHRTVCAPLGQWTTRFACRTTTTGKVIVSRIRLQEDGSRPDVMFRAVRSGR